jgi:Rrf2 family transcriptional regulator, iron-sulfur cluster assembly transcription factor
MRITTKGRYALRAVIALAETSEDKTPVSIKTIATKEEISPEFLEQIFFKLRKAGFISSVRGPGGGFFFSRPLSEITLCDIIEASGEGFSVGDCSCGKKGSCNEADRCPAGKIWREMDLRLREYAESKTLEDILKDSQN